MKAFKNIFNIGDGKKLNPRQNNINENNELSFIYEGRSTVKRFTTTESGYELVTNGKPQDALNSLKEKIDQGYVLKSFVYNNSWDEDNARLNNEETRKKDRDFSRANRLADFLNDLSNKGKLSSLDNLEIKGLDFSLNKENGDLRTHHVPLQKLIEILNNNDVKTLNLQDNNLGLFDVKSLLTNVRGSKGAIIEEAFLNQTKDPAKQDKINEEVAEFIKKRDPQKQTGTLGEMTSEARSPSPTQDTRERSNSLDQKISHLDINQVENNQSQRSPSPNSSPASLGIANPLHNQENMQEKSGRG